MLTGRRAGVLLHPTSLPGPFAVGDLGPSASRFLDWMAEAGLTVWQMLPLGPPGPGASPYDARSAFAGNALLISPERLAEDGLIDRSELTPCNGRRSGPLDFRAASVQKSRCLLAAFAKFRELGRCPIGDALEEFAERERSWLDDWSLFSALQSRFPNAGWTDWTPELRRREAGALDRARQELKDEIELERFVQFIFDRQWQALLRAARQRRITLFGDLPFYVARHGADVWSHRELFRVDGDGRPIRVAGVPPDYFSETGQLWGNPVYRWDRLAEQDYRWWIDRLRSDLRRVDLLRLDHFRGYAGYWEVAGDAQSAATGEWVEGPGAAPFERARAAIGDLPFVAEDLGVITDDVVALRDRLGLPGMHVLQFGFGDDEQHRPERHRKNAVVYTGTHDNDTLAGWLAGLDPAASRRVAESVPVGAGTLVDRLIDLALASRSRLAMIPVQDLLGLGAEARMNRPGTSGGNWGYRLGDGELTLARAAELRKRVEVSGRASRAC